MSDTCVLVVGSANQDLVFRSERLPLPGETLMGHDFAFHPGGKGANQAVAIAKLGGRAVFVSCVGLDPFGTSLLDSLNRANVITDEVEVSASHATGTACILVDDQGMNSIVVAAGANSNISVDQVVAAAKKHPARVALCQLEIPLEAVKAASSAEIFILNPAPARPLPSDLLSACTLLTPNESELKALTGISPESEEECLRAGKVLFDQGVTNVVVTLGARGSYWISAAGGRHFPAPTVKAIDTTAAGDAFNGALALFLAEGRQYDNAIALANHVGALSTTKVGAQASMPDRTELRAVAGDLL